MISESKHIVICINNKLNRLQVINESDNKALDNKTLKILKSRIAIEIEGVKIALDNLNQLLK